MRKILISLIVILLLVVGYLITFRGLNVLGINVASFAQLQDKNTKLEGELQQLSSLTSIDQPKAISGLNDSAKQLLIAKEEYNDKILYSSSENILEASQLRPYETEYLWTRLGNHAKDKGINLRYELRQNTAGVADQYDIYFTLNGSYVSISEFVSAIENDSSLNFKIESFKLIPTESSTEKLQATFVVRDIVVKIDGTRRYTSSSDSSSSSSSSGSTNTTNTTNTTDTDTTNTTSGS